MAIAVRTVETTWKGDLPSGSGTFTSSSSGALDGQVVTWGSRTAAPEGKTSPEELLGAAHSSCFSMAFNVVLGEAGFTPDTLVISSTVTFEEVDGKPTITESAIKVNAKIPGIDQAKFDELVAAGGALCPVSRLFASAKITIDAQLQA